MHVNEDQNFSRVELHCKLNTLPTAVVHVGERVNTFSYEEGDIEEYVDDAEDDDDPCPGRILLPTADVMLLP